MNTNGNGTALATTKDINLDELQRTASMLVASGYFDAKGDAKTQIAQLATKIMAGHELGYGPFASVQGIHVIQGKPQVSANLMASAVKAHPRYDYRVVKMADDGVTVRFFENGQPIGDSSFTLDDAKRAGTQNLQKFPRNMLFARALSNGVRWYCPDVFYGQTVYVEGEIGELPMEQPAYIVVDRDSGEVIEPTTPAIDSLDDVDPIDFSDAPPTPTDDFLSIPSQEPGMVNGHPAGTNGNGKAQEDGKLPKTILRKLHAVGSKLYGDEWDAKRYEIVQAVTKGKAQSSSDLTVAQAETLINGMENRLQAAAVAVAA